MVKKKTNQPVVLTREQLIERAKSDHTSWRELPDAMIGSPTRSFTVGEPVRYGGLTGCKIVEVVSDKMYVIEHDKGFIAAWWVSIKKYPCDKELQSGFFEPYRRGQINTSDFASIMHMYQHDGLMIDPTFQRGYVWTDEDRKQLLDSIFERMDIGAFSFIRNHGYLHKSNEVRKYLTLDGTEIMISASKDYFITVIDGQQRLTTLINFWLDRFTYKGLYFSQLALSDQNEFTTARISYRMINEENITHAEKLKMFLQVNRGVSQTHDHLEKVRKLYEKEVKKKG